MRKVLRLAPVLLILVVLVTTAATAAARGPWEPGSEAQNAVDTRRSEGSPVEQANKLTARRWLAAFEQADVPAMEEILAPTFVNHSPPLPADREGMIAEAVAFRAAFPNGKFTIQSLMAEANMVALYGHYEGDHTGAPYIGIPANGAHVSFDFSLLFRIVHGQITDRWATADDVMGLLVPLGFQVVPPGVQCQ